MGWFLVPKLGEKMSWGMYDIPSRKCSHIYDMQVTGKAKVHGIEGVELTAREASYSDKSEVVQPHKVQGIIMLLAGICDMVDETFTKGNWEE